MPRRKHTQDTPGPGTQKKNTRTRFLEQISTAWGKRNTAHDIATFQPQLRQTPFSCAIPGSENRAKRTARAKPYSRFSRIWTKRQSVCRVRPALWWKTACDELRRIKYARLLGLHGHQEHRMRASLVADPGQKIAIAVKEQTRTIRREYQFRYARTFRPWCLFTNIFAEKQHIGLLS